MQTLPASPASRLARTVATALLVSLGIVLFAMAADLVVTERATAAPASDSGDRYRISGDNVVVYNLAGVARLEPGSGSGVVVTVTRSGADAGDLRVETGTIRDEQTLRVIYPGDRIAYPKMGFGSSTDIRVRDDGTFGGDSRGWPEGRRVKISGSGGRTEAHADLRIEVPKGRRFTLRLAVGSVAVDNVDGRLRVETSNGPVATSGTRGELKAETGSGEVNVRDAEGHVDLTTGSGDVTLAGIHGDQLKVETGSGAIRASELSADDLNLETGSGEIVARGVKGSELRFETGSGSVEANLVARADRLEVSTGSGDVTLRVPEDFGADISFESGSGGFDTDLPVTVRHREGGSFRGQLGAGGARVVVETGSGDLKIAANRVR